MPRHVRIHFVPLRSSLVNLPISIYGPLLQRNARPQGLAIQLALPEKNIEVFVGWTGMASASSLAHFSSPSAEKGIETLEIDPQFAQGLGLGLDDVVEIGLMHDLAYAKSVGTEPLTADDWEILESHASHVESNLISQVRVANIGQEIDVWVLGRTRVRLRVVSLNGAENGRPLLLATDTEVAVAPKTRTNVRKDVKNPTVISDSDVTAGKQKRTKALLLRVLPFRLFPMLAFTVSSNLPLAVVSQLVFTELTGRMPSRMGDATEILLHPARVTRVPPPPDPGAPAEQKPVNPAPVPATTKVLNSKDVKEKAKEQATSDGSVILVSSYNIPNKHIVFAGPVNGAEEFDIVHVDVDQDAALPTADEGAPPDDVPILDQPSVKVLPGLTDVVTKCNTFVEVKFMAHSRTKFVEGISALLITGRSGAGKTSIAKTVAKNMENNRNVRTYTLSVDLSQFTEKTVPRLRELFTHWLTKARWHQPSVMIFDNIDQLMPPQAENTDSTRTRHIVETFIGVYATTFRSIPTNFRGVVMIATAKSSTTIHPLLKQLHVFEDTINVLPPNKDARKEILSHFVEQRILVSDLTKDESLNYAALATLTEGYAALDLKDLVARAVHNAAECSLVDANGRLDCAAPKLTYRDFTAAQEDFVPLSLRDVNLQKSTVSWADVGGLAETKKVLRETLEWPTKYARIFAQSPLRLRSGLLLYGYPGCGKTMLASAVAKECGLNFISVKGPEILNKYIGASEKSVRDLFERATAAKPCVLFFDEFDSIAPKRGHDSTGVTDRVVNQMLTQMDGAEGLEGVYVLAATSRPDLIDSALLRPGRLDKSLLCDMPSLSDRREILETFRKKVTLADDVDLEGIARATDGFTGADLQALVYNANLEAVHETIDEKYSNNALGKDKNGSILDEDQRIQYVTFSPEGSEKKVLSAAEETAIQRQLRQIYLSTSKQAEEEEKVETPKPSKPVVRAGHLRRVLETARPSVSLQEIRRLRAIYDVFDQDRSGGMPVPPNSTTVGTRVSLQ